VVDGDDVEPVADPDVRGFDGAEDLDGCAFERDLAKGVGGLAGKRVGHEHGPGALHGADGKALDRRGSEALERGRGRWGVTRTGLARGDNDGDEQARNDDEEGKGRDQAAWNLPIPGKCVGHGVRRAPMIRDGERVWERANECGARFGDRLRGANERYGEAWCYWKISPRLVSTTSVIMIAA